MDESKLGPLNALGPPVDRTAADRAATPRRRRARSLEDGIAVIAAALEKLSLGPGVYRMLAHDAEALYVRNARSLTKRVASYAPPAKLSSRQRRTVRPTARLDGLVT